MIAVDITTDPAFTAGNPRVLFEGIYRQTRIGQYNVTPDGQRFLMIKEGESDSAPTQIHVVLNWFEELKQRVPTN